MFSIEDHRIEFGEAKESLGVMLAQISPGLDSHLLHEEGLVRVKDPDRQAAKIFRLIEHAKSTDADVVVLPELAAPFRHLTEFERILSEADRDLVATIHYEHTDLRDMISVLGVREMEKHGLVAEKGKRPFVNFCRILVKAGSRTEIFSQVKLTPVASEFSLSARDTLPSGKVLHRFITNWGSFLFLTSKDYVGEVRTERRIPMFDFLKSLAEEHLHYVFLSGFDTGLESFIHAARAFYYLQEKSSQTFTVFLNTAELNNTSVIFPVRPHPKIRTAEGIEFMPLFEGKPGWGTQLRFGEKGEKAIVARFVRLDTYTPMPTKETFSPVYGMDLLNMSHLGIESEVISEEPSVSEKNILSKRTHNLPLQHTPFVGREDALTEIAQLLQNPSCRLLTLVGPGGIGKTRLALAAAADQIGTFSNGVYFVPLAPLDSADFLTSTIAKGLGFSFHGRTDPKVQLLDYLRDKEILLLMDNFEHLLEGTSLLGELLDATCGVKILATSREHLNLSKEWIFEVGGMRFPEDDGVDDIEQYSAVQLFVQSARRVRPDFSLQEERSHVIRICQLVQGMPLAIELASGWVRAISCEKIAQEIEQNLDILATSARDVPVRHRSVRAAFEHSWNLLSDEDRAVLTRMSSFRGGFRREAAAKVAGASVSSLLSLVNKCLVHWTPSERYEVHELLRQYAEERLSERPDQKRETKSLHSDYYAEFVLQRSEALRGKDQQKVLRDIEEEIENVRAAWKWATATRNMETLDKAVEGLFRFYAIKGWYKEGAEVFGSALDSVTGLPDSMSEEGRECSDVVGKILARNGVFWLALSDYEKANQFLQKSLDIFERLNLRIEVAFCLRNQGLVTFRLGKFEEAKKYLQMSRTMSAEIGDRLGTASAINSLGHVAYHLGEYGEAKRLYSESLTISRELGDRQGISKYLLNLGNVAQRLGEHEVARTHYLESLSISEDIGEEWGMAHALNNLGLVSYGMGKYTEAKQLYERSLAIKRERGDRQGTALSLGNLGDVAYELADYGESRRLYEEMFTICTGIGDRQGVVGALIGLAQAAHAVGERAKSKEYFRDALKTGMEVRAIPYVLAALVDVVGAFADEAGTEKTSELLVFTAHHPRAWMATREKAKRLYSQLAGGTLPGTSAEIEEKRLEQLVEELLATLGNDA